MGARQTTQLLGVLLAYIFPHSIQLEYVVMVVDLQREGERNGNLRDVYSKENNFVVHSLP